MERDERIVIGPDVIDARWHGANTLDMARPHPVRASSLYSLHYTG